MAAPHRRSTASVERRPSMPRSMPRSMSDDDYDLEPTGVADGFRPADVAANPSRFSSTFTQHHRDPSHPRVTPPPRPSSTTKPNRSSFTLRHDGATGPVPFRIPSASSSSSHPPLTRSSSLSTDGPFVRSESPYRGPAGPSHPYLLYAQEAQEAQLSRTASIATTSTIRVSERSYQGPSGPTHPYAMYAQNTAQEADADATQAAPVVVGFPGRSREYHRRLGPEGDEVADIIGPDGHTEQLPPYTKYPDEAFARKARTAIPALPPGAGGIGLATRNPEFASREDLYTPPSPRSARSIMSVSTSHTHTGAITPSEKPQLKSWQRVARRRLCGIIPIWAICLAGVTIVLIVVIILAVLFSLWHKHPPKRHHLDGNGRDPPYIWPTPTPSTFDASPFTVTPTNIPHLPTGTFAMRISTPSAAPSTCLDAEQSNAWSCSISPGFPYELQVGPISRTGVSSDKEISLGLDSSYIPVVRYGAQPPVLYRPRLMFLAVDKYDTKRGPAWFFQTLYDKLVILPEGALPIPPPTSKRAADGQDIRVRPDFVSKGAAEISGGPGPGDHPWFCYWNNTLLEAFIYVNDTSIAGAQMTTTSSPTASTTHMHGSTTAVTGSPVPYTPIVPLPSYPKVVKIQERRISSVENVGQAYCVQQYITDDGTAMPYMGDTGQPVKIYLNETEAAATKSLVDRRAPVVGLGEYSAALDEIEEYNQVSRERTSSSSCGCVWVAQ